ncbi:MAG: HNH endonuclease [Acidaminococcaceae bacterium]|nr:HNH endonuclease [Acidaminococcaceae bacterium]MBQ9634673.1 HNH endonuclease [Acidaminococcaceae bacterium]
MLKACARCGCIHAYNQSCQNRLSDKRIDSGPTGYRNRRCNKKVTDAVKFRRTAAWQKKRLEILDRDRYLCKVCLTKRYVYGAPADNRHLQVHHIVPIEEDAARKLDDDNLITLCPFHHSMAEGGEIPRTELFALVKIPPGEILNFFAKCGRPTCSPQNTNFSPMGFWSEKNEK